MLSESDCKTVLQNYLRKNEINFKKFEIKPISEDTEGFMGDHYKLLITHVTSTNTLKTEQFFMKTKPMKNSAQDEMVQQLGMYKREIFLYDILLKEFAKYGYDTSFAATSYHCLPETVLVLDDLTLNGYSITERHEAFSLEHVRCALDALAGFHACGYAYQRQRSPGAYPPKAGSSAYRPTDGRRAYRLTDNYNEYLKEALYVQFVEPDGFAMNWWRGSRKTILKLISLLEGVERFAGFEDLYLKYKFGKMFADDFGIEKTCGHGDLWSNNLMFKYENNVPVKCRLLDFQLTRYFYPSLDVILVIFCNTDAEFRKLHLNGLYKYYFESLRTFLRKYECSLDEIHPWEDFLKSIKIVMPDALTQVLLVNCIINLPIKKVSNLVNNVEDGVTNLMFNNTEFVIEGFKTDDEYKRKIMEVLEDFYDVLANESME